MAIHPGLPRCLIIGPEGVLNTNLLRGPAEMPSARLFMNAVPRSTLAACRRQL